MRLAEKISKASFWKFFIVIALFVVWDFAFTYFSIAYRGAKEGNPFHVFWINIFGAKYFLFMIPIASIILYAGAKLGGKLIYKKNKEVKGENHIAMILILIMAPNIINQLSQFLFRKRIFFGTFNFFYIVAIIIIIIYCLWIDYEIKRKK